MRNNERELGVLRKPTAGGSGAFWGGLAGWGHSRPASASSGGGGPGSTDRGPIRRVLDSADLEVVRGGPHRRSISLATPSPIKSCLSLE
ncbi:hypothetical protein Y032_0293g1613 [Ancylostoma ceylanicum]|uniref:Uncharacterized protein n=1 Tax=Ancylostoma ceylanicum TaxID=53326 RepID=A0A016S621_9BILA|nr:hypothetical protein Y032_0293g1613 [Ancylostoma ceylanicum]